VEFYFEELKDKDLSWHWCEDRRCLYLRYKFGIINKESPDSGNLGFISEPGEYDGDEWFASLCSSCYCVELERTIFLNKKFKPYDFYDKSLESAKFKIELLLLGWF